MFQMEKFVIALVQSTGRLLSSASRWWSLEDTDNYFLSTPLHLLFANLLLYISFFDPIVFIWYINYMYNVYMLFVYAKKQ